MKSKSLPPAHSRAFTLVEVMVAIGMVTFALVTVVSLVPSGIKSHKVAIDQAKNVTVLNDLTRAVKGVHKVGSSDALRFLPPLENINVGSGTSTLWLNADGTVSQTKPPRQELRGTIHLEQLTSAVPGLMSVSLSVAWPGTATYGQGKWSGSEGSVSTFQYLSLPQ